MTKTSMTGKSPREVWSVNLSGVKFYASVIIAVATVLVLAWGTVSWAGSQIFDRRLKEFHGVVQPQINRSIDQKIEEHHVRAMGEYTAERAESNERLAKIEQQMKDQQARLSRIEDLLWELVQGGGSK
jgi:hypothetical protein